MLLILLLYTMSFTVYIDYLDLALIRDKCWNGDNQLDGWLRINLFCGELSHFASRLNHIYLIRFIYCN